MTSSTKPLWIPIVTPEYQKIMDKSFYEYGGLFSIRIQKRFSPIPDLLRETRLGRQLWKYIQVTLAVTTLLWRLWKYSHHGRTHISNEDVKKELELYLGKERLESELIECGKSGFEEFCDSAREFIYKTREWYYSGAIGSLMQIWDCVNCPKVKTPFIGSADKNRTKGSYIEIESLHEHNAAEILL